MLTIWDEEGDSHSVRLFHIGESSVFTIDHELVVLLRNLAAHEVWRNVLWGAVKYKDSQPKEPPAVVMDYGVEWGASSSDEQDANGAKGEASASCVVVDLTKNASAGGEKLEKL